jgi:RNA-directed DNA polymerase
MKLNVPYHEVDDMIKATKKMFEITGHNKAEYHEFFIPKKSGGMRKIEAPSEGLRELQKLRLLDIYKTTKRPYFAHGFERGRGIFTNAKIHCGKKHIMNIDIKDFFPSCTRSMARKVTMPAMEDWEFLHNDSLPQGAPTSPAIANRIMASTDNRIMFMLRKWISDDVRYTRYADDITVSSNSRAIFSRAAYEIIEKALVAKGFTINKKKVRKISSGKRLEVTGLVINSGKPTVPRKFRRNVRAAVHNATFNGCTGEESSTLEGQIGHIALCHPKEAKKLRHKLSNVTIKACSAIVS